MNRDGRMKSVWQEVPAVTSSDFPEGKQFDLAIIGAGITGMTCAYRAQKMGLNCIVLEAANLGFGTTAGTTAHLNTIFDASFDEVISDFGEDDAKLFAQCGPDAINFIKSAIAENNISCDFDERTGFIFSVDEEQNDMLQKIVEATQKVGLQMEFVNDSPFPVPYLKIASIPGQAQFHPIKYLRGLTEAFIKNGGMLVEECRVTGIENDELLNVKTTKGEVKARHAFYATHIPPGVNILHFRCAPYRSYAMAVTLADNKYPEALGYDLSDPYHYYRTQETDGKKFLIVGGEDHKTGHEENTEKCFRSLESHVRKFFDVASIDYKWSSQYYESTDGLPYIGHLPGNPDNVYCATGFQGNGMIFGTLGGIIISDLVATGENKYKELFRPSRIKPVAGFETFVKENASVVASFIGDKLRVPKLESLAELAAGEAKVVKYEGHTIALYKETDHVVHAVNAACTHVKCNVMWNNAEQSWDCPCHGSRFKADGQVLTGPAALDLEKINLNQ